MRRSAPIARRTPLRNGAWLRRADPRTGPSRRVRALVLRRDGYACVCCGQSVIGQLCDLQHRDARGMGGTSSPLVNSAANLLTMLRPCHRRVESRSDPEDNARGYWLRMGENPLLTPVMVFSPGGSGVTAWPTLDGRWIFEAPVGCGMTCTRCGEKLRRDEAVWLMPGWPNPWNVQTSVPFHRGCVTAWD